MPSVMSRRGFLAGCATVSAGFAAGELGAAPPPKETGLSSEGLLVGHPGFQPRTVMPLPRPELPGFLSRTQLETHHAAYVRDVGRLQDIERQLQDSNLDDGRYGTLRREQVAIANRIILHEFYFENLAPGRVEVPAYVERHMREHIGSTSLYYLSLDGMQSATKLPEGSVCRACFTREYPTSMPAGGRTKLRFEPAPA